MNANLIPYGTMSDSASSFRPKNKLTKFEERVNSEFGCYYFFVYFEILTSAMMIMFDFLPVPSKRDNKNSYYLQWLAGICMIIACILIIAAKTTFRSSHIKTALKLFYLGLIFGIIEGLVATSEHFKLFSKLNKDVPLVIVLAFPVAMILDLVLIAQTDKLLHRMTERGHCDDTELLSL